MTVGMITYNYDSPFLSLNFQSLFSPRFNHLEFAYVRAKNTLTSYGNHCFKATYASSVCARVSLLIDFKINKAFLSMEPMTEEMSVTRAVIKVKLSQLLASTLIINSIISFTRREIYIYTNSLKS